MQIYAVQAADDGTGAFAFQTLQLAKIQAQPQIIYTSSKAPELFLDKLREPYESLSDEAINNSSKVCAQVRLEKASTFNIEQVMTMCPVQFKA